MGKKNQKFSYNYVKSFFKEEGYILISDSYTNCSTKLNVICPENHKWSVCFNSFRKGTRCKYCFDKIRNKCRRIDYSFIKKVFEDKKYILISKPEDYKNVETKLDYICPEGHGGSISYHNFKSGQICAVCNNENGYRNNKYTIEFIKDQFEKKGYKLLTTRYKNNRQKLNAICPEGHRCKISYHNFNSDILCKNCSDAKRGDSHRLTYEEVKKYFEKYNYVLLSKEYKNISQKLNVVCPEGHKWSVIYNNFQQGTRCPRCYHPASKAEQEVADFLKPHFSDLVQNDRLLIGPLELDIVIPSKKIAIEYCGLYWHSELNGKDRKYHLNKLQKCNKVGYNLITIFEDEWINKKSIVCSRLKNILGVSDLTRIYARLCVIKEIDAKVKNIFLNRNHLQGKDNSSIKLGAFYKEKLISVMTFSKGNISKGAKAEEGIWELNRFCSVKDYIVVGIASKLFKYFIREYNPREVFSYSDRRWSTGNLYQILGFRKSHDSDPNYWYIVEDTRIHRFNFRKSVLNKKLEIFDKSISEWENMKLNGFNRVWDCGNTKWSLNKKGG